MKTSSLLQFALVPWLLPDKAKHNFGYENKYVSFHLSELLSIVYHKPKDYDHWYINQIGLIVSLKFC